jgi:hypothetical protein
MPRAIIGTAFEPKLELSLDVRAAVTGQVTRPIRSDNLSNLFRRTAKMAMMAAEDKARRRVGDHRQRGVLGQSLL